MLAEFRFLAVIRYPFVGSVGLSVSRTRGNLHSNCLPALQSLATRVICLARCFIVW